MVRSPCQESGGRRPDRVVGGLAGFQADLDAAPADRRVTADGQRAAVGAAEGSIIATIMTHHIASISKAYATSQSAMAGPMCCMGTLI